MYLIDSHCHLSLLNNINKLHSIDYILFKSKNKNIKYFLNVSISLKDSYNFKNLYKLNNNILYSCGVHPLNSLNEKYTLDDLIYFSSKDYIVAIGETGLDYLKINNINEKIVQQKSFINHIFVSNFLNKPIIIHNRKSENDILKIINKIKLNTSGIWHCFNGDICLARKILNNNFYISFSGLITFYNSCYLKEVIKFIPLEKILIETDSPFLSPEPNRGKINYPYNLFIIVNFIKKIKLVSLKYLSKIINENFLKVIKLNNKFLINNLNKFI